MLHPSLSPLVSLLAATSFALASASGHACELSEPQKGTVAEVKDGETLQLTDRTIVRLVNAKAPTTAPIATRDDRPWPMVDEAKKACLRRRGRAPLWRHAHRPPRACARASYVVKGGERIWLQGELVGAGLARVYSFPVIMPACVSELLAREAEPG